MHELWAKAEIAAAASSGGGDVMRKSLGNVFDQSEGEQDDEDREIVKDDEVRSPFSLLPRPSFNPFYDL